MLGEHCCSDSDGKGQAPGAAARTAASWGVLLVVGWEGTAGLVLRGSGEALSRSDSEGETPLKLSLRSVEPEPSVESETSSPAGGDGVSPCCESTRLRMSIIQVGCFLRNSLLWLATCLADFEPMYLARRTLEDGPCFCRASRNRLCSAGDHSLGTVWLAALALASLAAAACWLRMCWPRLRFVGIDRSQNSQAKPLPITSGGEGAVL